MLCLASMWIFESLISGNHSAPQARAAGWSPGSQMVVVPSVSVTCSSPRGGPSVQRAVMAKLPLCQHPVISPVLPPNAHTVDQSPSFVFEGSVVWDSCGEKKPQSLILLQDFLTCAAASQPLPSCSTMTPSVSQCSPSHGQSDHNPALLNPFGFLSCMEYGPSC